MELERGTIGRRTIGLRTRAVLAALVVAAAATLLVLLVLWSRCGLGGCPSIERLRAYQPGKASRLLTRTGAAFAELSPVEGRTVPLGRVPTHVRDAFVAVEDQRFYRHGAVDWRRVVGATIHDLRDRGSPQGSSTITMQLARTVFPDRIHAEDRTLGRKLLEIRVASEIEQRFTKDEILELYLSSIYFGSGARGIDAASRAYFGIAPERLSLSQGALLAALIRGPAAYDPRRHPDRARERRDLVLRLMERQGRVSPEAAKAARAQPLGVVPRHALPGPSAGTAPYFVEEVRRELEERFGERLYTETLQVATTLDATLQRAAETELERQLERIEGGRLGRFRAHRASSPPSNGSSADLQGAVVALDVASGDVLAWVGGRDFRASRFDRVQSARRQAGSAFKPFVYAAALRGGHSLTERVRDEPIRVRLSDGGTWEPKNFDDEFDGEVTLRDALVRSKNVPTVRLAQEVGLGEVGKTARQAGIRAEIDETPAMPLGTVAVSPLELATAYSAFAGLGRVAPNRLVLEVRGEDGQELWKADPPKTRAVMDPGVAYLVTDVLREVLDRGTGVGARAGGFDAPAAGKTGTTNDGADAWFVGYTPRLVAAVWIGFDDPRPIVDQATGGRLAAPVWGRVMAVAGAGARGGEWPVPPNVVKAWVDPDNGRPLAPGCRPYSGSAFRELFLRASMPALECPEHGEPHEVDRRWKPSDEDARDRGFHGFWRHLFRGLRKHIRIGRADDERDGERTRGRP
jgi:1A family penicillin-binding protein